MSSMESDGHVIARFKIKWTHDAGDDEKFDEWLKNSDFPLFMDRDYFKSLVDDRSFEMATVRYDSRTNSTLFTTCCGSAIRRDQEACPSCGGEIVPRGYRERHDVAMRDLYGSAEVDRMRELALTKDRI